MAKKTKQPAKTKAKTAAKPEPRTRKAPRYKSFKLQKRIPHPKGAPIKARSLLEKTIGLLWSVKKPLIGLVVVYALLNMVFVRGFSAPINVQDIRDNITESFGESTDAWSSNLAIFGMLVNGDPESGTETAGVYQSVFTLLFSLALIWIFRQYTAGNKPTTRLALYRSSYPLVPTVLVLAVIGLQLLPFLAGTTLFSIAVDGGIAASGFEQAIWVLLLCLLALLSLYLVSSSIFALYIVTLPDMTPMKALRSARQLVLHRRFAVMRRLLWMPLIMLLLLAGLLLPTIFFAGWLAPWLYFVLSMLALPFIHAYAYSLYRELL